MHMEKFLLHLSPQAYRAIASCFFRWQARREHDRSMRAGLIPSRALQERRIVEERKILMAAKAREFEGRSSLISHQVFSLHT